MTSAFAVAVLSTRLRRARASLRLLIWFGTGARSQLQGARGATAAQGHRRCRRLPPPGGDGATGARCTRGLVERPDAPPPPADTHIPSAPQPRELLTRRRANCACSCASQRVASRTRAPPPPPPPGLGVSHPRPALCKQAEANTPPEGWRTRCDIESATDVSVLLVSSFLGAMRSQPALLASALKQGAAPGEPISTDELVRFGSLRARGNASHLRQSRAAEGESAARCIHSRVDGRDGQSPSERVLPRTADGRQTMSLVPPFPQLLACASPRLTVAGRRCARWTSSASRCGAVRTCAETSS
jgi:hypothetical protein